MRQGNVSDSLVNHTAKQKKTVYACIFIILSFSFSTVWLNLKKNFKKWLLQAFEGTNQ